MKSRLKNSLLLAAILFIVSCGNKTEQKPVVDAQALNETFKSIVQQENLDFYKKDIQAWSKHFAHSESVYWVCVEDDVTLRATGWNDLNQFVSQYMKENPTPEPDSLLKLDRIEDFQAQLSNELAFVRYKKNHVMPDGKVKVILESRTFLLTNKEWKILSMVSAPGYATPKSTNNVFIHNDIQK